MPVPTYTKSGSKSTTSAKLPAAFGENVENHQLLKDAYVAYLANGRSAVAQTKDRSEVRGGGRKPWRQKGTGRARHGSIRSPIWRGGGVTFGPSSNRNFTKKINQKAKQKAVRQALSLASQDGVVAVIEDVVSQNGKTKDMANLLTKLGFERNTLVVVDNIDEKVALSSRNIPFVTLKQASYLNVYEIMNAHHILVTKKALEAIETTFGGKK